MGNTYRRGLALSALGVLIISPDAMLVRLIAGADPGQIAFWRTGLMGCSLLAFLLGRTKGRWWTIFSSVRGKVWITVGLFSFGNISFVGALTHTSVANTLVILATMPFFAATLGWVLVGEKVRTRTWLSVGLALVGTGVLVSGSGGSGHMVGDALALLTALMQGLNLVVLRRFAVDDLVPPLCLSGFISALVLIPAADPFGVSAHDFALLGLIGLLILPLALALFFSGARFVPAAEAALFTLIETALGPFWAWLGTGEAPKGTSVLGGAIVFAAIMLNTFRAGLEYRRRVRLMVLEKSGG